MSLKSAVLIVIGFAALSLGAVGVFIPIMPTTPFVLVSAACFGSSSPALYKKLANSRYFGEFAENYKNKSGVTKAVKVKAVLFLWTSLLLSAIIFTRPLTLAILFVVGICVTAHILLLRPKN